MKIKNILLGASVFALTSFAVSSIASANDDFSSDSVKQHYSIGVNLGTSMVGMDVTYKINNYLEPKVFGNYFQWTINDFDQVNTMLMDLANDNLDSTFGHAQLTSLHMPSEFKAIYANVGAGIDFHPFKNGFFLSTAVAYNNTNVSFSLSSKNLKATMHDPSTGMSAQVDGSNIDLTIDGLANINLKNDLGNARVDVKWNKIVPYFGVGFRGNFAEANLKDPTFLENLGFTCEMGAYYYGKPTVEVTAHSGVIDQKKIDKLNKEIKDQIDPYTKYASFWPVFKLGLSYRF